ADAILAADDDVVIEATGAGSVVFRTRRVLAKPEGADQPAMAVAGVASPERFFDDLRALGCTLLGARAFRDHYSYSKRDVIRLTADAKAAGARILLTTEKDYVRLL